MEVSLESYGALGCFLFLWAGTHFNEINGLEFCSGTMSFQENFKDMVDYFHRIE